MLFSVLVYYVSVLHEKSLKRETISNDTIRSHILPSTFILPSTLNTRFIIGLIFYAKLGNHEFHFFTIYSKTNISDSLSNVGSMF